MVTSQLFVPKGSLSFFIHTTINSFVSSRLKAEMQDLLTFSGIKLRSVPPNHESRVYSQLCFIKDRFCEGYQKLL